MPDLDDLMTHWRQYPPPHVSLRMLAQAMAGWKPPEPETAPLRPSTEAEIAAFIAAAGG